MSPFQFYMLMFAILFAPHASEASSTFMSLGYLGLAIWAVWRESRK